MTDTRQKIIDAATRVFAQEGLTGATTRKIALAAKINEVTLFRYFKSKDDLLRDVVNRNSHRFEHVFAEASFETPNALRRTVRSYGTIYAKMLLENEDFIRTFLGELTRHPDLCRRLFVGSAKSFKIKFIDYLKAAKKKGLIRSTVDPTLAADSFSGMLMAGVLRRPLTDESYSNQRYVKTCIDIFLKGIEP